MDSQVAHPHGPTFDDQNDPYNAGLPSGEGVDQQPPQGKTSGLMKKVKAKAKKIKDSLAKHSPRGHGPDHGHDDEQIGREYHHVEEDEEEDDDDDAVYDDDEEMGGNPEIHGAPMYESAVPKLDVNKGESGVSFGKDVPRAPVNTPVSGNSNNQTRVNDGIKNFEHVQQGNQGNQGEGGVHLGRSLELKEDPHSPKGGPESHKHANYQTKVADPTCAGGDEAGVAPILNSFGKMSVHDEPESKSHQNPHIEQPTKTHDQFTPDHQNPHFDQHILPTKTHDEFTTDHQKSPIDQHIQPTKTHDEFTPDYQNPHIDQHTLPTKTHDQFTTDHQKPPIDQHIQPTKIHDQFTPDHQTPTIDQHIPPTETHDQFTPDISMPTKKDSDQPLESFTPDTSLPTKTESDQPLDDLPAIKEESGSPKIQSPTSTYTDKLTYATSALTGTAISAKNVVASKLGYGGTDENSPVTPVMESREVGEGETTKAPSQGGGYGSTIYNTVAGAGTTVMSKVTSRGTGSETEDVVGSKPRYGGKDDNNVVNPVSEPREIGEGETTKSSSPVGGGYGSTIYNTVAGAGATVMSKVTGRGTGSETEDVGGEGTDKGVPVKQQSWSEKLKPGEEDRALSESISDALFKRNKDEGTEHKEDKPMGKVTESEEVARRLGTGDEHSGEERVGSGEVKVNADAGGANKGMVNMVKGAVTSWFGKGEVGHGQEGTEEHKVQESSY